MARRTRLRTRVLLLTAAFAIALFAITFGLSWRAQVAQERWSRLVGVETRAIGTLEELIRAQNAYRAGVVSRGSGVGANVTNLSVSPPTADTRYPTPPYRVVSQLLEADSLRTIDTAALRRRMSTFTAVLADTTSTPQEIDTESQRVVAEAQRIIDERKREVARQLPMLERDSHELMSAGLAIAWIIIICSFAAVQVTLRKVVRPIEDLSLAADAIASGDLGARAPVAGDFEVARLAVAVNHMADELKAHARTDELTSLPNFRAFRERIDLEIERAQRYPERFGILILDLDRFKKYNDTYGHLAGNDALQRTARAIREAVRVVDFPARYGGEEFAVILPQIDAPALAAIAERIRSTIEAMPAPAGGAQVTVSIGAAMYPDDGTAPDALFRAADERLYAAKEGGRNRVVGVPMLRTASGAATRDG
ncbi:MAG: diguanylate cyclase [Acidobacteria bacterium]|nr:diguanylate cyclase [Acidobacteriota bacterium]MBV9188509.1 diguanylate cyclase [Acidobacteriota bacterium]